MADTFIADICYSGHFFWAPGEHFGKIYLLIADNGKNRKHMGVFVLYISLI